MPIDIQRLADVVKSFRQARIVTNSSVQDGLEPVSDELRALANEALTDDPEMIPVVVGLIHLLLDIRDGTIPEDAGAEGLQRLEGYFSQGWLPQDWADLMAPWVLRGGDIQESPGLDGLHGCTLMRWGAFCDYYAAGYGKTKFSPTELEQFWNRVERGRIEVLEREIHLDGANRVVWFTDEDRIRRDCPASEGGGIDADRAYDQLGLDWSRRWEGKDDQGRDSARAVLFSVPLKRRFQAARGSHAATALEGWGFLGFVPGELQRGGVWPSVGSFTVNPVDGQRSLPEGVHGPLDIDAAETCPVEGCGRVAKSVSDRLEECGKGIVARAIARL